MNAIAHQVQQTLHVELLKAAPVVPVAEKHVKPNILLRGPVIESYKREGLTYTQIAKKIGLGVGSVRSAYSQWSRI